MKDFAELIKRLESTNKTNAKLEAIISYLETAADDDKLWFIALFTGKRPKRTVATNLLKEWTLEITGLPYWLFVESYSAVGDLGETISLLLPPPKFQIEKTLSQWMSDIIDLKNKTEAEKKEFILHTWDGLEVTERFIFNKLIGGSFRIGVSHKTLVNALAKFTEQEPAALMHSIMGKWDPANYSFSELIQGDIDNPDDSKPYPFCLAHPLEKNTDELGDPEDWQIEYKWDGIRGQLIKRNDEIFIWSRGEELVTDQFPELVESLKKCEENFVIDGEIIAWKEDRILNFSELQKRLNRKTISKKMLEEIPVKCIVYDLLELEYEDLRQKPLQERRKKLENWLELNLPSHIILSQKITSDHWDTMNEIRNNAREINAEGLMLKHRSSVYHAGRKRGDWWKWKINPYTIDAVLIYAQKGSGRRSGYYTDYTFAVKDEDRLVTVAKAYSGLTDKEIMEVSRFVNKNALEKFGPVRTVKPELVFEIAFEGISYSKRHKSGVALRFPRIVRWRKDKTAEEIDHLDDLKKLITD